MAELEEAMTIRPATVADLPAISATYNHYVVRSTCTFRIETESEEERAVWFAGRSTQHPVTVAEEKGEVFGWGSLSPWIGRCAYARTVEASVYVRHDRHRRGIGKALLLDLIARARQLGHHTILGGICTEQAASLALVAGLGFVPAGCLRQVGYKFGRWLDVAYMQLLLRPGEPQNSHGGDR